MTATMPVVPAALEGLLSRASESIFIGGMHSPARSGKEIETLDPATGRVIANIAAGQAADVDRAVRSAEEAGQVWRSLSPSARGRALLEVARLVEENAEELATLETLDNGKPLSESLFVDLQYAAEIWRYFGGWCSKLSGQTLPVSPTVGDAFAYTRREPLGVVGAIVPWNFPLMIASWKVAPALAAGNAVVLKPSELTSLTALRLAEFASDAGLPPGVLNVVTGYGPEAGQALVDHPGVAKITFTGSTATGRRIVTSSAANLPRLSLELGGKSANIVFPDADLGSAAQGAIAGIFLNQGQVCCAGSRLFVHDDIHDDFVQELTDATDMIEVGHGLADGTEMGPLVSQTQLDKVLSYIDSGRTQGAVLACGGDRGGKDLADGYFVRPTVFTDVRDDMAIAREEIFGPVLSVFRFNAEDEVVRRANASSYGLAAGVWTTNLARAHRVAHELQAGTVWVNAYNVIDPVAPFGGYKDSGYGRDLGEESLLGYTQTKTVWIGLD